MSFTADGKYLTGQELETMSAEQLASEDTRYVEIDLTEDEVRERVFGSVATPEMREELLKFGKTKGFKDRARMVYDKAEGDFVILGDDLTVAYQGRVENPSALLTDVNDSRFAEPAGSARGFQANQAQNRLEDAEFAEMMNLKQGEQATQLAGYLPAQRAKVATKRFMGELTFIPGQDETTFSYLTVGPDGRRETRTYNIKDLIDSKVVTDDDEDFARYREMTGATDEATPRERRQFDRMFRPPLFGKGRQYRKQDRGSRRARVKAGDLTSEVETYQAEAFEPREPVVETPEVSEETPKDEGKAKKPGGKGTGRDPFTADLTGGDPDEGPSDEEMMRRYGKPQPEAEDIDYTQYLTDQGPSLDPLDVGERREGRKRREAAQLSAMPQPGVYAGPLSGQYPTMDADTSNQYSALGRESPLEGVTAPMKSSEESPKKSPFVDALKPPDTLVTPAEDEDDDYPELEKEENEDEEDDASSTLAAR
jgi:hypothetical protein